MAASRRQALSLVHRLRPADQAAPAGRRPPLLLLLHGVGSNELAMAALAGAFDPRFVVVSARAPSPLEPFTFAWLHEVATSHGLAVDPAELTAAVGAVRRFIGEAVEAYTLDREHVFIAGFSQGGIVALSTVLSAPNAVAGVVCMSGRLPPEILPHVAARERLEGKPVLVVHGRADATLGVAEGRAAYETLKALSLAVEYAEFAMGHATTDESLAAVSAWLTARLAP
jgi:phospholipase/carboxylesterase